MDDEETHQLKEVVADVLEQKVSGRLSNLEQRTESMDNHLAALNGRVGKIESWQRDVDAWFAKQLARAEVEAEMLLSRRNGKSLLIIGSIIAGAVGIGAGTVTIINGLT